MKRFVQRVAKGLFGTAVAVALSYGSAQAAASPAQAGANTCSNAACEESCINAGYDYGMCSSTGTCRCKYWMCSWGYC